MAGIVPFRGVRYATKASRDVSTLIAPPYDTVAAYGNREVMLGRNAHNIVAIDLPHVPPKVAGPVECYERAGATLQQWLKEGILVRDEKPAIYVYRQTFVIDGQTFQRRGFISGLQLEELGKKHVLPHEQTYSGPKEDRLLLAKHTQSHVSQVFCLYEDPTNTIANELYATLKGEADYVATMDGVKNEVWVVTDAACIAKVASQMADKPVFIADGHHRYSTALMYRDWLIKTHGPIAADHPANCACAMFVSMSEPGLLVLPTHRVILNLMPFRIEELQASLRPNFDVQMIDAKDGQALEAKVAQAGEQALAFVRSGESKALLAVPKNPKELLDHLADKYTIAWRMLAVAILHHYVLDLIVWKNWHPVDGRGYGKDEQPKFEYFHRGDETMEFLSQTPNSVAIIVPPTPVDSVRQVCSDRMLMPQKSTFFYPKLATGLVMYPMF